MQQAFNKRVGNVSQNIFWIVVFGLFPFKEAAAQGYTPLAPIGKFITDSTVANYSQSLGAYINGLFTLGVAAAGFLAVIMIVVGGIQYIGSDVVTSKAEAKGRIQNAVLGLVLALSTFLILKTINADFLNTNLDIRPQVVDVGPQLTAARNYTPEEQALANSTPKSLGLSDPNFDYMGQLGSEGQMRVRSTYYYAGERYSDPDTDAGRSSTGVPLRAATEDVVGVAAVDPRVIPYGSLITVQTDQGLRYYIAADTGGAVKNMTASGGSAPVVDFYSNNQVGGTYTNINVTPYRGSTPFTQLPQSQRAGFFDIGRYRAGGG